VTRSIGNVDICRSWFWR